VGCDLGSDLGISPGILLIELHRNYKNKAQKQKKNTKK
jgi:hypothetical protein